MTEPLDRAIVVTGASTGIGRAAVARAVAGGAHVFASVRKRPDLEGLKQEFGEAVTPLLFDVTEEVAVRAGASQVAAALGKRRLYGLVNNAGVATPGPLLHLSSEELAHQLDINLIGVHRVTQAFAPLLGADKQRTGQPGRIVMISSGSGEIGSPFVGAYAASKFALEGYSQSLRRELMLYGIDVIVVGPGPIATPIWEKAAREDVGRYDDTDYAPYLEGVADYVVRQGREGLPASDVAELIWRALTIEAPKTRYAILRDPFKNRTLPRLLSPRALDKIIARRLGFPTRP